MSVVVIDVICDVIVFFKINTQLNAILVYLYTRIYIIHM